jgi:hypothetical protein
MRVKIMMLGPGGGWAMEHFVWWDDEKTRLEMGAQILLWLGKGPGYEVRITRVED